ncbi:MAG: nidogen-like domain-containing protein [Bacteroidia bacterium]
MKKLLLAFACFATIASTAQTSVTITAQQYETLKQNNQLDRTKHYYISAPGLSKKEIKPTKKAISKSPSSICSCLIALDSSFSVVPFTGGTPPDYRNDDFSSDTIHLPFSFNFYGISYNALFINNNGNVSFTAPYYTFTSDSFPSTSYNMIAPFWGDVDTRDSASGLVYYKITPTAMIVKWENVGYYSMMSDKMNTFQLIITDGTDPILPSGNNVAFCYGDMQWTTGAASSGVGGFGGVPATVGTNEGDGISYFQVGRFDNPGTAFDGPYGSNDQVDWLDNQGMYFNTGIVGNIPPIVINNNICDTIDVFTGDTTHSPIYDFTNFTLAASTPEPGQTVSVLITTSDPLALTVTPSINLPTYKQFNCTFSVVGLAPGIHTVTIKADDNGTPSQETLRTIYIRSHYDPSAPTGIAELAKANAISIYPNPADGNITVTHNFNASSNPVLSITNVIGQNVMNSQLNNQQQSVDISGLKKGIYFATIISKEGKSATIKIVRK